MDAFSKSFLLAFVLLNPFIMSVYLLGLIRSLDLGVLARQLIRAGFISFVVFAIFAWAGDRIFEDVLQIRFSSFLVFGGLTFLIIGIRLILGAGPPVEALLPDSGEVSGTIAMPFIVGPGTISAAVLAGSRLSVPLASLAIALALACALGSILLIKLLHDYARARDERLVHRYSEVAGRVTALFTGAFAIEMIFSGIERWLALWEAGG
jgi:multiple antibiotic resistance protein